MTREEFEKWLRKNGRIIQVEQPYVIEPCHCGDINCKGWRIVNEGELND